MSKKAEEALNRAYPGDAYYYIGRTGQRLFKEGYEQAEKDLALTWKDVREIICIDDDLCNEWGTEKMHLEGQEAYYEAVLEAYKSYKEKKV